MMGHHEVHGASLLYPGTQMGLGDSHEIRNKTVLLPLQIVLWGRVISECVEKQTTPSLL